MLKYLSMIPGFDLVSFAQSAGPLSALLIVAAIIFAENGLLIGFFLPGDSLLFTIGFLIQGTPNFRLDLNINIVIATLFVSSVLGSAVGYMFGRRLGPRLFNRPNSILFHQKNVERAQEFYDKNGGKTIIIARFIPIIRTFVPLVAGVAKMNYKTFMTYNLIGGALWTTAITYLGFSIGELLHSLGIDIDTVVLPIVALIVILSVGPAIYHLLKDKSQCQAIWTATKLEFKKLFRYKR